MKWKNIGFAPGGNSSVTPIFLNLVWNWKFHTGEKFHVWRCFWTYILFLFICLIIIFQKYFWEKLSIFFWTFDRLVTFFYIAMLPLTLFFNCRHEYSFSSGKKWLFSEILYLFLQMRVHSKNNQLLLPYFPLNKIFD